jgi:hypothetical protein
VTLGTKVVAAPELSSGFVTGKGYQVKLTLAQLSTGALYYFDGAPAIVSAPPSRPTRPTRPGQRLAWAFGLGEARAHPGHYTAGAAVGQVLSGASIDLLSAPSVLPHGNGISGAYRSATFSFAEGSPGPAQASLGDAVALVEGSAEKDGASTYFRFSATYAEVSENLAEGRVPGCVFSTADVDTDGTVTLTVHPRPWFDLVDFDKLPPGSPDAPSEPAAGDVVRLQFTLGLAQLGAYAFSFSPSGE